MAQAKVLTGRKVRYAVVGVGWNTQAAMLPGVEHTGNSEWVALVTGYKEKAAKIGEKYGVAKVYSYDELDTLLASGDVDAVYLATPNFDHVEYAVKTLEAGIHLLLEKPMGVSVADCERMIGAAKGSLFSDSVHHVGSAIEHVLTVGKDKSKESVKKTDHFGGELKYFSECLLERKELRADGEEGMLDVRVLAAVEESLKTGAVVKLAPFHRRNRPVPAQVQMLSAVLEPERVESHKTSEGK